MSYRLRRTLDRLTRRITCCKTFDEFINQHPSYTPSIYPYPSARIRQRLWYICLARQYDLAQQRRGDPRRAYTGQNVWLRRPA